jgi:hypothetical protein
MAPAATVDSSRGHSRLTTTAPGRCSGSIVATLASASSLPIEVVTWGRRPSAMPMIDAATHQPAPTSTSVLSASPVAAMTVTIASIVAAPALSITVVLSRSTKRTAALRRQRRQQRAHARRPVDEHVGHGLELGGRLV